MEQEFNFEKWVWTEADFDQMGWHDVRIYAIAFSPGDFELAFDIDYIFQWSSPKPAEKYFKFWIAPATLLFTNVNEVEFDIESYNAKLEINELSRTDPRQPRNAEYINRSCEWLWTVDCQQGEIRFRSVGYEQFIRALPQLSASQTIDKRTREISFSRQRVD